ncbi:MAG: carboxylating nicotinate-nucleotide diphosphorylase [bacterium]|nr:carboxylating nicotinate-nucleotide diphosphorylase [bacterium]
MNISRNRVKELVTAALKEDIWKGDVTTEACAFQKRNAKAKIIVKQRGVIAGLEIAKAVFETLDNKINFQFLVKDGTEVKKGDVIAELSGHVTPILAGERTALNFLQRLSGIATLTREYVEKVKPYKARIFDTRKTTPGLRDIEKYAVSVGGGQNHRMGLYDMVLIKDNHLKIANGNIEELVQTIRRKVPKNIKIEIEAENLSQFREALQSKVDIIMLDNMDIQTIKKAVSLINNSKFKIKNLPEIEVSGDVTLDNVEKIAKCGVDRISVGKLTHSAKSMDISLRILNS